MFVRPRFMKRLFHFEEVLPATSQYDPDELLDFICDQFISRMHGRRSCRTTDYTHYSIF